MKKIIISSTLAIILFLGAAQVASPARAATVTLFTWTHAGSGTTSLIDTSGYAPGWTTTFWCTGKANDHATLTEYDTITTPPVALYSVTYRCNGVHHTRTESNSLFYESWHVAERLRDTARLVAQGQCISAYC